MSKATQILPKEAVPDKPLCSRLTLEAKHSGVENTSRRIVGRKHNGGTGGGGQHGRIQTSFVDTERLLMCVTETLKKKRDIDEI